MQGRSFPVRMAAVAVGAALLGLPSASAMGESSLGTWLPHAVNANQRSATVLAVTMVGPYVIDHQGVSAETPSTRPGSSTFGSQCTVTVTTSGPSDSLPVATRCFLRDRVKKTVFEFRDVDHSLPRAATAVATQTLPAAVDYDLCVQAIINPQDGPAATGSPIACTQLT